MKKSIIILAVALVAAAGVAMTVIAKDLSVGKSAPDFKLTDTNGQERSLKEFQGKFVVLEWTNHGCPFVVKHYDSNNMQNTQKELTDKGVVWLSICSSAKGKQGHMTAAEWNETTAKKGAHPTAVLLDEKGKVGKLYGAKTTPHMFVVDPKGMLIYQGAIDDLANFSDDVTKTKNYVLLALNQAMAGKTVEVAETKSYGCSVKY